MVKKNLQIEDILALSPMQAGILYDCLRDETNEQYFEQLSLRISAPNMDINIFKKAWQHVFSANQMLRSVFVLDKGKEPIQIIRKNPDICLQEIDLSKIGDSAQKLTLLNQLKTEDLTVQFDLQTGPLCRLTLCRLSDNEHELIISNHHIIFDGWSSGILIKDFIDIYRQLAAGSPVSQHSKVSYKNFIKWIQHQDKAAQKQYWTNYLDNLENRQHLERSPDQSVTKVFPLATSMTDKLKKFAIDNRLTLGVIFYATLGLLLTKYTNASKVVFGTVVSGRPPTIQGIEEMVGLFINSPPFYFKTSADQPITELLASIQTTLQQRRDYENTPLVDIKKWCNISARDNLFNVLIAIENYPINHLLYQPDNLITLESYSIYEKTNFPFTIEVFTFTNIELKVNYQTDFFKDISIDSVINHYLHILQQIIDQPTTKTQNVKLVTPEEAASILARFNDTTVKYPDEKIIHQLFEEQVVKTPDHLAVCGLKAQLTYAQLNQKANQLARLLRTKGVGSDKIVGIMVEHTVEMIVGVLGIIKAGGAYLPLDSKNPESRIQYMLTESEVSLLLTQGDGSIPYAGEVINLRDESIYTGDSSNPNIVNTPEDLIYIIFTSGSTGEPKGVMIEHHNVNRLISSSNLLQINNTDRIMQTGSLAFDASTFEIWGSLLNSATLFLTDQEILLSSQKFRTKLARDQITILFMTTALFNKMTEEDPKMFAPLRMLMVGGEVQSPKYIRMAKTQNPHMALYNVYGPTESTTFATSFEITNEYLQCSNISNIPIGKPLSNTQVFILDKDDHLQPIGIIGELCVAGGGLARGYLNLPELTEEKFITNPFKKRSRLYRTGDLARWLVDGNIEFEGRVDSQVKIRGFRIEIEEIELKLLLYQPINEVVVISERDEVGKPELWVYYSATQPLSSMKLRTYLRESLPEYMVPYYYVQLPSLPLNANGKIDRTRLPKPQITDIETSSEYIPPANNFEVCLATIFAEVLQREKVGVTDDFFDLGGHSLRATQLVTRISKEMNLEISIKNLFDNPTIRGLANYLKDFNQTQYSIIPIVPKQSYYPLSSAQKRFFTLDQFEGKSTNYNISQAFIIKGDLDLPRLEESFQKLIKRHESLRTSFHLINGQMVQKIHLEVDFQIQVLNYQMMELTEEEMKNLTYQFVCPFNLGEAPLLRTQLVRTLSCNLLIFDTHHIISDGRSMEILLAELIKLYYGEELSDLRVQYKEFAVWQSSYLTTDKVTEQLAYWKSILKDNIPVLDLPTDFKRPSVKSFAGDTIYFDIDQPTSEKLDQLAVEQDVTLYMILLAIFNILLTKYSGQDDIIIGSPVADRPDEELEGIIGVFINTLTMRNHSREELSFKQFLQEVRESTLSAYDNQQCQLEMLVEELELERSLNRNPLFDILFVLHYTNLLQNSFKDLELIPLQLEDKIAKLDLTLSGVIDQGGISMLLNYSISLFKPQTAQRMAVHYLNLVKTVVENPEIPIGLIEMITAEEKVQILSEFNQTTMEFPEDKTIHQLFEEQVIRTPDKIAVQFNDQEITYQDLNYKSNQLACQMQRCGVGGDQIIAILLNRSLDMLISILGILKAGGSYLPIDPKFPYERIKYLLNDSRAAILITEQSLYEQVPYSGTVLNIQDQYVGDGTNLPPSSTPDNLAYIIYTSGSTGNPKGVMIEHRSIVNYIWWRIHAYQYTPEDTTLQLLSYSFDGFGASLYSSLLSGGKLIFLDEDQARDFFNLKTLIKDERVTSMGIAPFMWKAIIEKAQKDELTTVRVVALAGEPTSDDLLFLSKKICPHVLLVNEYGPTEGCIATTAFFGMEPGKPITIGKPIYNKKVYILDRSNNLLPIGIPGELCIAGVGLARGYLQQPELTELRFSPDPFNPGEKMYHTGDLARWLEDGNLDFIRRIDSQVKIRGYRIELKEIEKNLLEHPLVKEALVIDQEDDNSLKYLSAYVISKDKLSINQLRQFLTHRLPSYMIPAYFVFITEFPLLGNGKIDLQALPKPEGRSNLGISYVKPETGNELILAKTWSEVLNVESVGIKDNFFTLGGDSIKAIQISSRLQKYNLRLSFKDLFQYPTIEELADYVKPVEKIADQSIISGSVYLTPIQQWFFNERFTDMHHHNQGVILSTHERIEKTALTQVFTRLLQHHDALRMVYQLEDKQIIQSNRGLEEDLFTLDTFDLRDYADWALQITIIAGRLQSQFDLSTGPLIRVAVFSTPEEDYLLIITHHLVIDGVSWRILLEDFSLGYEQKINSQEISFQPKTTSYQEWARILKDYAQSKDILSQIPYWKKMVEKAGIARYTQTEPGLRKDGKDISITFTPEETKVLLTQVNVPYNTELSEILITGLVLALKEWSGAEEIALMLEGHGREEISGEIDVSRTVGWFTSFYPVVFSKLDSTDLVYKLKMVKETLRTVPDKGIGYGILKYLNPDQAIGQSLRLSPQVLFNYLGHVGQKLATTSNQYKLRDLSIGNRVSPDSERQYILEIIGIIADNQLQVTLNYNQSQFSKMEMTNLSNLFQASLQDIITHCTQLQSVELTPSDLDDQDISLEELDQLSDYIQSLE